MKKVIILSVTTAMLSVVAFAQDSIPKNNRDSLANKNGMIDTSLSMGQKNWTRDSLKNPKPDSLFGNNGNTDSLKNTGLNGDQKLKNEVDTSRSVATTQQKGTLATSDLSATVVLTDRVMMKDEKMYLVKGGEIAPLDKTYKLETGALVSANGNVKFPSGKTVQLKNGQFIELKPAEKADDTKAPTPAKKVVKKKPSA